MLKHFADAKLSDHYAIIANRFPGYINWRKKALHVDTRPLTVPHIAMRDVKTQK